MAVSKVSISNQALSKLNVSSILSLTENSKQARSCNLVFDDILTECLTLRAWNFATKRVQLGRLLDAPLSQFTYKYQLPVDCLQVLEVINIQSDGYTYGDDIEFKVEDGKTLLCDCASAQILYIKEVTDMSELHPLFRSYFTTRLAYELCYNLTGNSSLKDRLEREMMTRLRDAKVADGMEIQPRAKVKSSIIDVRWRNRSGRWV